MAGKYPAKIKFNKNGCWAIKWSGSNDMTFTSYDGVKYRCLVEGNYIEMIATAVARNQLDPVMDEHDLYLIDHE